MNEPVGLTAAKENQDSVCHGCIHFLKNCSHGTHKILEKALRGKSATYIKSCAQKEFNDQKKKTV